MKFAKVGGEILKKIFGVKFYSFIKFLYQNLFEKYYFKFKKTAYNKKNDLNLNIDIFEKYNLDIDKCKNILSKNNLDFYSEKLSWHFHFFSSIVDKDLKILEIGTHNGEFSKYLSNNLPNSKIYTIDVSSSDHTFLEAYQDDKKNKIEYIKKRNKNLDSKNIYFKELNSFYLLDHFKNEEFDYIWLDGDHLNPQVSIDIFSCLKIIKKGGLILCDDVIKDEYQNVQVSNDSYITLKYLKKMNIVNFDLVTKRISNYNSILKKYLAIIQKQ